MNLLDKIKQSKGRNQARMEIKYYCVENGIDFNDYKMTPDEDRAFFSKLPYSPYSSFDSKKHEKVNRRGRSTGLS